jgi:hypothetical protein
MGIAVNAAKLGKNMAHAIVMTGEKEFKLTARGCDFTLVFDVQRNEWAMYTVNAMVRAYNRGYAIPKFFATLAEVEAKYKAWRGIAVLAA